MTSKDAIRYLLTTNAQLVKNYVSDLTDGDLVIRPDPGANHIAWQLGHLIVAEAQFFITKAGAQPAELPAGFVEKHAKDRSREDSSDQFLSKAEYLAIYDQVRAATLAHLDAMPESDLDKPSNWIPMAPTVGAILLTIANHDMMHAGQFTVVRRKLGKPVLF